MRLNNEKDLVITIGDDLKWTGHIDRMIWTAVRILGMLKRKSLSRGLGLWKDLYASLVKPQLRVCCASVECSSGRIH